MSFSIDTKPVDPERLYGDDELCQVFGAAEQYEHQPYWRDKFFLWRFILGTGLRISEALALRVPEDCTPQGILHVRTSKTGRPRSVRTSPELFPYYAARLATSQGARLFPIRSNKQAENWWKEVEEISGVEHRDDRSCHGGRHSFSTWELASRRLSITEVQMQLGHKDASMTLGQYTHAIIEMMWKDDKTPRWWSVALQQAKVRAA